MKKILFFIIFLTIVGLVVLISRFVVGGDEDSWICVENQWVKHGQPTTPMPSESCGEIYATKLIKPAFNEFLVSPLILEGIMPGDWYFEANAIAELYDANGLQIAVASLQAQEEWMTSNPVLFKGIIDFKIPNTTTGTLVLKNDNPSDLPKNNKSESYPVKFGQTIKVFFNNNKMDPEFSCNKVFPVERKIKKTEAVANASMEELLKGVTEEEKNNGFFTNINSGVKINSLDLNNGILKIDFDDEIEFQVGGSCRVTAIRAQIIETLKQFSTVKEVIISVNGRVDDILQP
ncbi:MAG: hypothetical protein COU29_02045 [Candidatus Magasanikbacteria bacterium CG10_big_fil_rev_8_21_14_0_10_36_32]|uniref:GerMN domain-containing protein n=1 Tax=Candidatus Magasanikbacteria bacterium CG10_big_fil_rev_8_21_14_0_10_36_32 TaxID=1974646 RepID=A0A2M6W6W2_9BACT|nr:MAG: hypothetical protein COU29_02045 [Candidatus Magasanikbacteria bacterium CG10_big_fil_rev_8_21_14_0_10_36_32]